VAGPKYRLDRAAFRELVLNAPWMVAEMDRRAQAGYEYAVTVAPVESGEYKESFIIFAGTNGGAKHNRAYAALHNYSDHALEVEFGTERQEAHHVLTRTLGVMGA